MTASTTATGTKSTRGRVRRLSPDLGKVDHASAESSERQVYRLLKKAIMAGVFAPGAAMTSRSIAEAFGVSASPVRDALKRLEADEVIEGRSKSAYFIRQLTAEDYWDILNLRVQLEGYAVRMAAQIITEQDIETISTYNQQYENAGGNVAETLRINFLFHFHIYRLAQSQRLINLIETLWTRSGPTLYFHTIGYDVHQVADNHGRLIEALRLRNAKAAVRALERDLIDAAKVITSRLQSNPTASRIIPFPHSALED
jgi:GntR family colanic acid and biofilm gene transcriptional regulator